MLYSFNNLPDTLVSSTAIKSTDSKVSNALLEMSLRLPIGVDTTYNVPNTYLSDERIDFSIISIAISISSLVVVR